MEPLPTWELSSLEREAFLELQETCLERELCAPLAKALMEPKQGSIEWSQKTRTRERMRPRLSRKDLALVLEGLSVLFRYHSRKKHLIETREIHLLFEGLSRSPLGRRSSWMWNDHELIPKRREYYLDMLKKIKEIKESKLESETPSI